MYIMLIMIFVNFVVAGFNIADKVKTKKRREQLLKVRDQRAKILEIMFELRRDQHLGKIMFEPTADKKQETEERIVLMSALEEQGEELDRILGKSPQKPKAMFMSRGTIKFAGVLKN